MNLAKSLRRAMSAMLCGLFAWTCSAGTVTVSASKDNTLYQTSDGSLSDALGPHFYVGENSNNLARRGLVAFDLTGVPANAVVSSATLTLNMSRRGPSAADHTVSIHSLTRNWGEGTSNAGDPGGTGDASTAGDATWLHAFYSSTFWTTPGGDFSPTVSASLITTSNGAYPVTSAGLAADVQRWIQSPATNFGWILIGNESAPTTADRFDSRNNTTAGVGPTLTVVYAVPEPAAISACVVIGGVMLVRRRGSRGMELD